MSKELSYQEYVERAKNLLKQIESYQYKIASMALKVCEIRHGGKSDGLYTITDFASDIGMNRKTLSEWVHIYRDICLKADIKKPSDDQWANAAKASRILKSEMTEVKAVIGKSKTKTFQRKDVPKEKVVALFKTIEAGKAEDTIKFERIYESAKFSKSTIVNLDLKRVDSKKLIKVMESLDFVSDHINDFLSSKQ